MKKTLLILAVLVCVLSLLTACGSNATGPAPAETAAPAGEEFVLGIQDFTLSASTWSSPNGATVHLTATPYYPTEGYSASFVVMLLDEEVANEPCVWDGETYTASVELNAADDLHYYIRMKEDGKTFTADFPINTPDHVADETLINLASSLVSYCTVFVEDTQFADGKLTVTSGFVQVQAPCLANNGETVSVSEAKLQLLASGEEKAAQVLTLTPGNGNFYEQSLSGMTFDIPSLEEDHQLTLVLTVKLSNGQILMEQGGTFFYNNGELVTAVG